MLRSIWKSGSSEISGTDRKWAEARETFAHTERPRKKGKHTPGIKRLAQDTRQTRTRAGVPLVEI